MSAFDNYIDRYVVVRDNAAGVNVGYLVEYDLTAKTCVLRDARKIWYWEGRLSCHGIACKGIDQQKSKVDEVVPLVASTSVVELIACMPDAEENLRTCPVYVHK